MPILLIAIVAMLMQQTVATTAKVGLPALFPALAGDLSFNAELVLLYTWIYALVSLAVMAGCGGMIRRFGALRTSQIGCLFMGLGVAIAAGVPVAWIAIPILGFAACLISVGSTVATPASSQILAAYAPQKWAPLIFSVKQTGVPAGVAISGLILVPLGVIFGWREALLGMAVLCVVMALVLQPVRRKFDEGRDPSARPRLQDFVDNIRDVLDQSEIRALALAAFSFVGMQAIYMNFTITYLYESLEFSLEQAGQIVGTATCLAIPARVFWGWLGSTIVQPRTLMAILAVIMSTSVALMGAFNELWNTTFIVIVNCFVSLSVLSWHGVLLSEAARLAPAGEAGRITGGILAFGAIGQIVFPIIFGAGYWIGGYGLAFMIIAIPAAFVSMIFVPWRR